MWKRISKLEVAVFRAWGYWSNPKLTDRDPGNLVVHEFLDLWDPWEPLFMGLNIPNYFENSKNNVNNHCPELSV